MKSGQKGFTAVEGLLILILLAILGFTGYYVWHTQKQTDKTLNTAASEQLATPNKKSSTAKATTPSVNYFVVKELGVKFADSNNPKGLTYSVNTDNGTTTIEFASSQLSSMDSACKDGSLGVLTRTTTKPATEADTHNNGQVAKVSNYYYSYTHVQNPCSSNSAVETEQSNEETALISELKTLQTQ